MSTPENSTAATPRRRRRKDADQPPAESAGTAEVVYLADSEAERLARTQGRIRTKTGKFLRPLTDLGNTERYSDSHGGDLLYVDESGRWRGYNGKHWADTTKDRELHTRLIEVARSIWAEAEQCRTGAETTEVRKHAKYSESKNGINAAKSLLSSEYAVSVRDFDPTGSQADTLNVINGTLDLETFELRPHRKEDMLAKFAPVVYDPTATAPNWESHLEWSIPDSGTRETVQRYFGYALTNETREQKMLCFYGAKGRNGKGVIVRQIEKILGYDPQSNTSDDHAYAQAAPASLLMASKRSPDAPSGDLARLVGKRFVSLQETGQGQKFDEVRLKALTGGDAIPARFLHQDYFQFTPVAKYVLVTNHRPEVHGDDPALWRRLFLVNFPHSISDEEIDNAPDYEARIQAELSGILNWMLDGLRKWRESGLQISDAIRSDTNAYRREQDTFGAFVDECLEPAEAQLTKISLVYSVYKEWAQDNGVGAFALPRFRRMLEPKIPGLYDKRTGNPPERYYGGLRFKEGVKMDAFVGGRGHASNPATRPDPSPPPGEHTQAWDLLRSSKTQQADVTAAPAPEPAPVPEALMSVSCQRGHHDECARDRAMGWLTGEECECGCHHGGAEILPLFEPQPDPADTPELTDEELDMLAQLHADTDEVAPEYEPEVEPEPEPEPTPEPEPAATVEPEPAAEPERYSERAIRPWKVKPSAYADLETGEAITDDGTVFSIAKRGKGIATLAELLRSVPDDIKFVHLTGAAIGTDGTVTAWANTRLPKGWERTDRGHDSDEARDRISLRYRRPDGTQLVVYRAAGWLGRDVEETTSPAALRDAFALLLRGIGETFGDVVGGDFGVPLKSTPAATGVTLIQRTLPRGKQYPILPADLQHLIRSHAGQARSEDFAAETHPSRGAHIPERIPGLYVWDMRFAYAALLDQEMPCGPVIRDTTSEFARVGKGWELCLYRLRVTVPQGWDRVGRFRRRAGETDVWVYPNQPGETFETWAWERTVYAADRDGWRIGEHVEILERVRFTGGKTKPLATFGRHLRALRDEWIPAQSDVPEQVRELGRIMARQIAIAAIGKLAGAPYSKLRSCPIESLDARPADARRSDDGKRWEWREKVTSTGDLTHPEWAAYIWSTCRDWLYDHPKQPGVGLRHVPLSELIAARTDGYWTSTPQPVIDTGVVGHFRPQLQHGEPIATPRTYGDLNATRDALLAAAEQEVTR